MIAFPDTSFLCALYVQQDNSRPAAAHFKSAVGHGRQAGGGAGEDYQ